MNGSDRERVKELLSAAARLPAPRRREFIELSAENEKIAREAAELLHTLEDSNFLSSVTGAGMAGAIDAAAPLLEGPGTRIGRYKLLQRIGEGGFGTVFMAEQAEPVVRRVALKIIKAGMDTRQVIARFEAERQALAMMDHPNIARVLDAGATETGRPYFVMELVRGEPVTQYCDRESLSIDDRLMLFRDICGAVQHAHQKGIIHRDIKPSNVLVTVADGRPLPKVIDFGIAKATAVRLTDKTLFTELHQLVGTPEYMSPEQAEVSGIDIDTRSDVYALGVLLYELLAGDTPFDGRRLRSAPLAEMQRIIRDEEPQRPSLRLRTMAASSHMAVLPADAKHPPSSEASAIDIAKRRRTEPISLSKSLRGDLDWIVMKCLEKDRSRRYGTASALAGDVSAYLAHEPVSATPPSVGYKLRKLVERHQLAVLATTVMAVTLIVATTVSIVFAVRASRALSAAETQKKLAEKSAEETQRVAQFQQSQLSGIDPEAMGRQLREDLLADAKEGMKRAGLSDEEIAARQAQLATLLEDANPTNVALKSLDQNIFERAMKAADEQFADQPVVKARLLQTLAKTLVQLGLFDRAAVAQREALDIRLRELGADDPETMVSHTGICELMLETGRFTDAEPPALEALRISRLNYGEDQPETLSAINNVGLTLLMQGRRAEAEVHFRDLLERQRRVGGDDSNETLLVMNNVAGLLYEDGKLAEAEALFREAYERRRQIGGDDQSETLHAGNNLALVLEKQGRIEEAERLYRDAMERSRRNLGEEHHDTLLFTSNLGFLSCTLGKLDIAERLTREALDRRRKQFGNDVWDTMQSIHNMGIVLQAMGRLDEAEQHLREAVERRRRVLGGDHFGTLQSVSALGVVLRMQGKLTEAEPYSREAVEKRRTTLGNVHPDTLESINSMGELLLARGQSTDAEALFREVEATGMAKLPGNHPIFVEAQIGIARCLQAHGKIDEAATILTRFEALPSLASLPTQIQKRAMDAHIALNVAKDKALPDQGYDTKAAMWRARLGQIGAATKSTDDSSSPKPE